MNEEYIWRGNEGYEGNYKSISMPKADIEKSKEKPSNYTACSRKRESAGSRIVVCIREYMYV